MGFRLEDLALAGKVALVTGASRGIGKAIALGMAGAGADVVLASRELRTLEVVAAEIQALDRSALAVPADVGRMEDIGRLVKAAVERFARIDILVNCAGTFAALESAMRQSEQAWDAVMNLNLKGLFFLSQTIAKTMQENGGGTIVNMSSGEAIRPGMVAAYDISKAAVIHATRVMAKQWGKHHIRVNAIAPGFIRTEMTEWIWSDPDKLRRVTRPTPLGRAGEPDEIVGAAIYLASNAASFVTGQTIVIDGGISI